MRFRPDTPSLTRISLFAGLLLLGACSFTDRTPKLVRTAPVDFASSFADMSFKLLPPGKQVRLAVNDEDPLFHFEGGASHYEALALPDLAQPYLLRIDSEVLKSREHRYGAIFFPVITLLDENKNWIPSFDALPYVTQKPVTAKNYITVSLQISDEIAAARYLVIHTQEDKLNMAIGYYDGETLMQSNSFNTMMTAPLSSPRYRYEFISEGWVRITASSARQTPVQAQTE